MLNIDNNNSNNNRGNWSLPKTGHNWNERASARLGDCAILQGGSLTLGSNSAASGERLNCARARVLDMFPRGFRLARLARKRFPFWRWRGASIAWELRLRQPLSSKTKTGPFPLGGQTEDSPEGFKASRSFA